MFGVTGLQYNQLKLKFEGRLNSWKYRFNYIFWIFFWIAGHIAGGLLICGLLGLAGSMVFSMVMPFGLIALGLFCCLGALHQFKIIHLPLPQLSRQVSRLWLTNYHINFTAFGYGVQLGSGLATRIKTFLTYAVFGCALCSGSVWNGALIGAFFGLSRALLPIALAPLSALPDKSFAFALKFNAYEKMVQKVNGVILLLSGIVVIFLTFIEYSKLK